MATLQKIKHPGQHISYPQRHTLRTSAHRAPATDPPPSSVLSASADDVVYAGSIASISEEEGTVSLTLPLDTHYRQLKQLIPPALQAQLPWLKHVRITLATPSAAPAAPASTSASAASAATRLRLSSAVYAAVCPPFPGCVVLQGRCGQVDCCRVARLFARAAGQAGRAVRCGPVRSIRPPRWSARASG